MNHHHHQMMPQQPQQPQQQPMNQMPLNQVRLYEPFRGPFDPCKPLSPKSYIVPPNLFMGFQPPNLPQFRPHEALKLGTLWPALYSPYEGKSN